MAQPSGRETGARPTRRAAGLSSPGGVRPGWGPGAPAAREEGPACRGPPAARRWADQRESPAPRTPSARDRGRTADDDPPGGRRPSSPGETPAWGAAWRSASAWSSPPRPRRGSGAAHTRPRRLACPSGSPHSVAGSRPLRGREDASGPALAWAMRGTSGTGGGEGRAPRRGARVGRGGAVPRPAQAAAPRGTAGAQPGAWSGKAVVLRRQTAAAGRGAAASRAGRGRAPTSSG